MTTRAEFSELGFRLKLFVALVLLGGVAGALLFSFSLIDFYLSILGPVEFFKLLILAYPLPYFWLSSSAGAALGLAVAWRLTRSTD